MELMSATQTQALSDADSPGEAAQVFLGAVTKGLAALIANELEKVVKAQTLMTKSNTTIAGWADLIGGCAMTMDWQRPALGLPVGQVVGFAPMNMGGAAGAAGIEFSAGVSVKGTF